MYIGIYIYVLRYKISEFIRFIRFPNFKYIYEYKYLLVSISSLSFGAKKGDDDDDDWDMCSKKRGTFGYIV